MAAPADRVQILKNESVVGGGSAGDTEDGFPTQLDPTEDAPEVQGFFIQPSGGPKDELVWITRDGSGNMILRDVADGTERTLSSLIAGVSMSTRC